MANIPLHMDASLLTSTTRRSMIALPLSSASAAMFTDPAKKPVESLTLATPRRQGARLTAHQQGQNDDRRLLQLQARDDVRDQVLESGSIRGAEPSGRNGLRIRLLIMLADSMTPRKFLHIQPFKPTTGEVSAVL